MINGNNDTKHLPKYLAYNYYSVNVYKIEKKEPQFLCQISNRLIELHISGLFPW